MRGEDAQICVIDEYPMNRGIVVSVRSRGNSGRMEAMVAFQHSQREGENTNFWLVVMKERPYTGRGSMSAMACSALQVVWQ